MRRTLLPLVLVLLGACSGKYYRVTDTSSGRVYSTRDVDTKRRSGAVSGATVTLQSSQVEKISEAQYQQGLASK